MYRKEFGRVFFSRISYSKLYCMRCKNFYLFQILSVFLALGVYGQPENLPEIKSSERIISYAIDGDESEWTISPELSPDRLEIYCPEKAKTVLFTSGIDSIRFQIGDKDTFRFYVCYGKERALTEVVGFKVIPDKIGDTEKLYYLSLFWSEAKYNFVNMDHTPFSWDSLYQAYIPEVLKTQNDYEYYRLMQRFAASLSDGHTQVSDNGQFFVFTDYMKILLHDFNQRVYIISIRKGCEIDSTFLGAEILSISGVPLEKYMNDSIFRYISASTVQSRWMQGTYSLHSGFSTRPFDATVRKRDGSVANIHLLRNGEKTRTDEDEYWGVTSNYSGKRVDLKMLDNDIAWLSINSFNESVIDQIAEQVSAINKSKGVIIDLRNNGGGSTEAAWYLQSLLSKEKYFLNFGWETRVNNGVRKANGNWMDEYKEYYLNQATEKVNPDTIFISDTINRITVPAVILIGRYTFSAAEDFLINMYEVPGRPLFIGSETGGSTGSPLVIPMPGDGYGRLCTRRVCFPQSMKPFLNKGISPDIIIEQTLDDYLSGKDVVLEKAVQVLNSKK